MMLEGENIVEVENVSKFYARKRNIARRRVGQALWRAMTGGGPAPDGAMPGEFAAVDKVSFSLARGEALGIIGLNGSGKTTLLRMLAGQILPDAGEIRMVGESAAMIDLTAGFQMRASGRENVFLRGAMLGRSRSEMEGLFNEIVAFAELEEAIDAPIATYSSGMLMRLAFAIMVQTEPDILVIDETLSVGDFAFRQKCLGRLREIRGRAAFVLVSHSMSDVRRFCDRVIVLHKGMIAFEGDPTEAVAFYQQKTEDTRLKKNPKAQKRFSMPQIYNKELIKGVEYFWIDAHGRATDTLGPGKRASFRCRFVLKRRYRSLAVSILMYNENEWLLTGFPSKEQFQASLPHSVGLNEFELTVDCLSLNPGIYYSEFIVRDGAEFVFRKPMPPLTIAASSGNYYGAVAIPYEWRTITPTAEALGVAGARAEVGQ